jgi:rSAM/selenodomain-associated transferase 2
MGERWGQLSGFEREPPTTPPLGVVIPCRNEAGSLPALLAQLQSAPELVAAVVVVDGGSHDGSARLAALGGAQVLRCGPNRGLQLAAGAATLTTPWLLLLHGDVRLPPGWAEAVGNAIARSDANHGPAWWFDLGIQGVDPALRLVELAVAWRSRWRQLPYGDQGLLLGRPLLERAGGIPPLPLMEDLELARRLAPLTRLRSLGLALAVSDRRWRERGVWQTTLANARLRRLWRQGIPIETLAALYAGRGQGAYQKAQRRCSGSSSQPWRS